MLFGRMSTIGVGSASVSIYKFSRVKVPFRWSAELHGVTFGVGISAIRGPAPNLTPAPYSLVLRNQGDSLDWSATNIEAGFYLHFYDYTKDVYGPDVLDSLQIKHGIDLLKITHGQ